MPDEFPNALKQHRKQSKLRQEDMRRICEKANSVVLSRYESGDAVPNLEVALRYHIALGKPLHELFPEYYQQLSEQVKRTALELLEELESKSVNYKRHLRKMKLQDIVNRIGCLQEVYDEEQQPKKE